MGVWVKNGLPHFLVKHFISIDGSTSQAQVLFCSMVSGFDSVHIRANLPLLEKAVKYGNSAGDR